MFSKRKQICIFHSGKSSVRSDWVYFLFLHDSQDNTKAGRNKVMPLILLNFPRGINKVHLYVYPCQSTSMNLDTSHSLGTNVRWLQDVWCSLGIWSHVCNTNKRQSCWIKPTVADKGILTISIPLVVESGLNVISFMDKSHERAQAAFHQ